MNDLDLVTVFRDWNDDGLVYIAVFYGRNGECTEVTTRIAHGGLGREGALRTPTFVARTLP